MAYGGTITAKLLLDASGFNAGMKAAQSVSNGMANVANNTSKAIAGMGSTLVQSAKYGTNFNSTVTGMSYNMQNLSNSAKTATSSIKGNFSSINSSAMVMGNTMNKSLQSIPMTMNKISTSGKQAQSSISRLTGGMKTGFAAAATGLEKFSSSFVNFNIWMAGLAGMVVGQWAIGEAVNLERAEKFFQYTGMAADQVQKLTDQTKAYAQSAALVNTPELLNAWRLIRMDVNLTADQMIKYNSTMGDTIALFKLQGRTATDAGLAIEDALGSDSWKRFKEIGIRKEDVIGAGWSGDIKDVEGFFNALQKIYGDKGIAGIANDTSSLAAKWENLKEKFTNAGIAIGTALIPALTALVGGIQGVMDALGPLNTGILVLGTSGIFILGLLMPVFREIGGLIGGVVGQFNNMLGKFVGGTGSLTDFFKKKRKLNVDCSSTTCGSYFDLFGKGKKGGIGGGTGILSTLLTSTLAGPLAVVAAGLVGAAVLEFTRRNIIQDAVKNLPEDQKQTIYQITNTPAPVTQEDKQPVQTSQGPQVPTWNLPGLQGFPVPSNISANFGLGPLSWGSGGTQGQTVYPPIFGGGSWLAGQGAVGFPGEQLYRPLSEGFPGLNQLKAVLNPFIPNINAPPEVNRAGQLDWLSKLSGYGVGDIVSGIPGLKLGGDQEQGVGIGTGIGTGIGIDFKGISDSLTKIKLPNFGEMLKLPNIKWPDFSKLFKIPKLPDFDKMLKLPDIKVPNFSKTISDEWNDAKNFIKTNKITGTITSTIQPAVDLAKKLWNGLKSGLGTITGVISSTIASAVATAKSWWNSLKSYIIGNPITGHVYVTKFIQTVTQAIDAAVIGPGGPGAGFINMAGGMSVFNGVNGLRYEGYGGHQKNPLQALLEGGNCVDMTLGMMMIGRMLGLPVDMDGGFWNGAPHVWAIINGMAMDPARKALTGSWAPPTARGPGGGYGGGGNIIIQGDVYGYNDFCNKVEKAMDKKTRRYTRQGMM